MFCFVVVVVGFVVYLREGATPQALPATTVSWETFQRNKQHPIFKFSSALLWSREGHLDSSARKTQNSHKAVVSVCVFFL